MKPFKENKKNPDNRFVLEGNAFYEIDEECVKKKTQGQKIHSAPKRRK